MSFLLQWGLPVPLILAAGAVWYFAGQIPFIGEKLRGWIIIGALALAGASFFAGYFRAQGENAVRQKVERNTNDAIKGGQSGARDARGCKPSELWDIGAGRCVEVGGGDRN